jgi:hypothetical protein
MGLRGLLVLALLACAVVASPNPSSVDWEPSPSVDADIDLSIHLNSTYVPGDAQHMLWLSVAAYCTQTSTIVNWTCNACQQFGPFTVTGLMSDILTETFGFVGFFTPPNGRPLIAVVFRGTVCVGHVFYAVAPRVTCH